MACGIARVDGAKLPRGVARVGSAKGEALKGWREDGDGRRQIGGNAIVGGDQGLIDELEAGRKDLGPADEGDAGDLLGGVAWGQLDRPAQLLG